MRDAAVARLDAEKFSLSRSLSRCHLSRNRFSRNLSRLCLSRPHSPRRSRLNRRCSRGL